MKNDKIFLDIKLWIERRGTEMEKRKTCKDLGCIVMPKLISLFYVSSEMKGQLSCDPILPPLASRYRADRLSI